MTRDQFLTKKMGKALRTYINGKIKVQDNPDFSTWEGFGKLWIWAKEQEWWVKFIRWYADNDYDLNVYPQDHVEYIINYGFSLIHPDHFADTVAKYLGWKNDITRFCLLY
jgi:hypothetical protein